MSACVLIVDDEVSVRFTLEEIMSDAGYDVRTAENGDAALAFIDDADVIISDLQMPVLDGMGLLHQVMIRRPGLPLVMLTARGSERAAVEAMKAGAFDYVPKPFELDELLDTVARAVAFRTQAVERRVLFAQQRIGAQVIAHSPSMKRLLSMIERLASRPVTMLIRGETGTGKEVVATLLHALSARADHPMVRFNCAALPDQLAESELFGHEKGAFTGATEARPGYIRRADGGTLMLDEIGELSLAVQAKVLRFFQESEIQPVGAGRSSTVDVRVIGCTNRDLREEAQAGRFRQDLYFRLAVVECVIPPLRERVEDIRPLAQLFLARYAERFGVEVYGIEAALLDAFERAPWPGNVRELENTIARMVALSQTDRLLLSQWNNSSPGDSVQAQEQQPGTYRVQMHEHERRVLERALRQSNGNRSQAARQLDMSRSTLIDKLNRHKL